MDIRLTVILMIMLFILDSQGKGKPHKAKKKQARDKPHRSGKIQEKGKVWSKWLRCTLTCGTGWQSRLCLKGAKACGGKMAERRKCNVHACPVPEEGQWSDWGPYSRCRPMDRRADGCAGIQNQFRRCNSPPPQNGGAFCTGCVSTVRPCKRC